MSTLNKAMILEKCETIVRCINRIREKTPCSLETLSSDLDSQDIIIINLERASQATVDIAAHIISSCNLKSAESMSLSHIVLYENSIISKEISVRMQKVLGMRNLFVHEYANIDWSIVWKIVNNHTADYIDFVFEIQKWVTP